MIKIKNGNAKFEGTFPCIMGDMVVTLKAFRNYASDMYEKEKVEALLQDCVRLSAMSDEALIEELRKIIEKLRKIKEKEA